MSTFLLYHRRSRPTGVVIARALGVLAGENLPAGAPRPDNIIRWGSRASLPAYVSQSRVVNSTVAVARASDKLGSLRVLRDAEVTVPNFSENPEELALPLLGRRVHHARGTDIVLCLQKGDWARKPRDYYVEYVPTVREFRVHVVDGRVIRVQGKYLDQQELEVPWVRNYKHGYRFRAPRLRLRPDRLETSTSAVRALGLDFGAVDLLVADSGRTYVLEVNTAPACSPLTAAGYVTTFARMLGIPNEELNLNALDILSPEDAVNEVEGEEHDE